MTGLFADCANYYFRRIATSQWNQVATLDEARRATYGTPWPYASGIVVAVYTAR